MIQVANKNHIDQILKIELESYEKPWSYQSFLNEVKNSVGLNLVYTKNNQVLGYLFGWMLDCEYHLNNIAVQKSERRKGIAKKMIDNIIFNFKIKNIHLEVSRLNKDAISLYEKIGFHENGLRKRYYHNGSDAILYKMEIK